MKLESLTTRSEVGDWLNEAGLTGEGVEIGVLFGENAEQILCQWKGTALHLVDPWVKQPHDVYTDGANQCDFRDALSQAACRLSRFGGRAVFHVIYSDEAFAMFKAERVMFDLVYLDGNHGNPQFARDLEQWWTLLKPGALYGGHDFLDVNLPHWRCDVKSTVEDFAKRNGLSLHVTNEENGPQSWWLIKP